MLIDGAILYLGLLVLLTFHEFGHAWMAYKCGDETAHSEGRVSLNPIAHIDLLGTVILPLLMIFLSMSGSGRLAGFVVGWAKPVPVNAANLRNPRVDDILVTLAGPWMNFLLAIVLVGLARVGYAVHSSSIALTCLDMAGLSLLLFFFNLLPIPPLDGSQVVRSLSGMSYEAYHQVARYGYFILIIAMQLPMVQLFLHTATRTSLAAIGAWFGIEAFTP
jgi:Zn-dependent protease